MHIPRRTIKRAAPQDALAALILNLGSASVVVPRARFESVKAGLGIVNEIVVLLSGNNGTLYIDGTKVRDFQGEAPDCGGAIGLWGQSQEDQANE